MKGLRPPASGSPLGPGPLGPPALGADAPMRGLRPPHPDGGGALAPPPRRCAAPPASPRGSGPLLRRAAGVPRLRLASPPSGFASCSSVRFVVAALVRPLRPLRGLRACAAPGPERFACAAAPARPRWGPSPRCGFGFGAPPAVRGSVVGGPGRGLASSQVCAWGAGGARLRAPARPGGSPLGSRPAPLRSALLRGPWGSVVVWASPLPPPARPPPQGAPGGPGPDWVGLRPPARFAGGSPRGSRFSRPSPASGPGGGGPPGPALQPGCQS